MERTPFDFSMVEGNGRTWPIPLPQCTGHGSRRPENTCGSRRDQGRSRSTDDLSTSEAKGGRRATGGKTFPGEAGNDFRTGSIFRLRFRTGATAKSPQTAQCWDGTASLTMGLPVPMSHQQREPPVTLPF
jgi:hypothetical protein